MTAIQANIDLTLDANRTGSTVKIISDSLVLSALSLNVEMQGLLSVGHGASDQDVSMGALTTATMLLLISDQILTVKLNGESTGHACANLFLTDAAITSITLSNAGDFDATVRIYLLG